MNKLFEFDITKYKEFEGTYKNVKNLWDYLLLERSGVTDSSLDFYVEEQKIRFEVIVTENKAFVRVSMENLWAGIKWN